MLAAEYNNYWNMSDDKPKKSSMETRYSLINRVKDPTDQHSWKEFISYYDQYIYSIIRHIGPSPTEAEDLSQEIKVLLWKKLPEFEYDKNKGKFRQWLSTIIHWHVKHYLKLNKNRNRLLEEHNGYITNQLLNSEKSPELDEIAEKEWHKHIYNKAWECVKVRLNEHVEKVYTLSQDGKSYKEISDITGIKENTVRVYHSRVTKMLKTEISKHLEIYS